MESTKDRDLKLAAARKKLKKYKTQKGSKPADSQPAASAEDGRIVSDSSAVESLLQLSDQLNGLLDDSANPDRSVTNGSRSYTSSSPVNGISGSPRGHRSPPLGSSSNGDSLMQRNQELADRVKQLQQKNTQLNRQMQIQTERIGELEKQINTSETESTQKAREELQKARERLEVHIQTIGILVEEKQTLQSQLSNSQKHSQQKSDEIDDFTSRLKASRLRVADLEKQLAIANTHRSRAETSSGDASKQLDKLKQDLYTKSRDLDEVLEQRAELEKQLQSKLSANAELEASLSDLKGKLDLSQAYIQQLNNGEATDSHPNLYTEQIEELRGQNSQLHENVAQLEDSLQRALAERNQTIEQYNQIIQSQQHDHQQIQSELESSQGQITSLKQQLQDFHMKNNELQRQFEDLQERQQQEASIEQAVASNSGETTPNTSSTGAANTYSEEQMQSVVYQYENLRLQCEAMVKNCETLTSDNQQLSRLLEEKEEAVSELESTLERIQDEKDNSRRLLETVEGDKSALSRALSQNKQLKVQLEELEGRFIKITEDNMNTMTSLQSEQHNNKELSTKLAEIEALLQQTSQSLAEKQNYIAEHEAQLEHVSKMSHQQEQLADRIRHYESQIQVMDTLQRELHSSQETIRALTSQNSELRDMIVHRGTSRQQSEVSQSANEITEPAASEDTAAAASSDITSSASPSSSVSLVDQSELIQQLTTTIHHLEAEKLHLETRCEDTMSENSRLSNQLLLQSAPTDSGRVTRQQYEALEHALNSLQDKYTVVMRSKAELLDRSEILEYENMQLEAESETINEYIALYHQQRTIMKSRAEDKDKYIQQLSDEREKVSVKLSELQSLVVKLLQERKLLQSYTDHSRHSVDPHDHSIDQSAHSKSPDDWPDYDSESDTSQVEAIINQSSPPTTPTDDSVVMDTSLEATNEHQLSSTLLIDLSQDFVESGERVPGVTAQRIMTLLSEIGHANQIDRNNDISHILHCSHCSGPVVSM